MNNPTSEKVENLPRRQKIKIAVIITASIACGVYLAAAPPEVQSWAFPILEVLVLTAGAVKFACCSILYWRAGRKVVSILWGMCSFGLALLFLPAIERLLGLFSNFR
ncbi:MAG: hypothetical protein AB9866_25590 [Syntrophobacteraceae bacterium]